jgi:hypothetical protein
MFLEWGEVGSHACCVLFTCSFCRFTQADLELTGGRKWHVAFLSAAGRREAFRRLGVQDVEKFDSD